MAFGHRRRYCLLARAALVLATTILPGVAAEVTNFKSHFQTPTYRSKQEWEVRRNRVRQQILAAAGLLPMPVKTPLRPRVIRHLDFEDYSIETVLIEPLPGYYLGGNIYRPAGAKRDLPAVLIPHGHWKHGRLEDQPSYSVPALGINLARQGYLAFAYDMTGYNDTRQTPHSFESPVHALWSFNPMGLQLWNSIRALDYVQSLPEVNGKRIGVTGASGGGSQTFFLTAVDDRVRVSAPVNMVSAYMQGGDSCEEAPNLRVDNVSNVEIAALAAPRPMLLVSSTRDWTRHTPEEEFPAILGVYALYGRPQNVANAHIDAEHNYNNQSRAAVYKFFATHLRNAPLTAEWVEKEYKLPPAEEMLAFPNGNLPPGMEGLDEIFQSWKVSARLQTEGGVSNNELRDALRETLGVEWPGSVYARIEGHEVLINPAGSNQYVTAYWRPGKGDPVLIMHPQGITAAQKQVAQSVMRGKRPVLVIEPAKPNPARDQDRYFLSYHRSADTEHVQDILTGLAFLARHSKGRVELIGLGDAGVWSLFAAALAPMRVDLVVDLNGFSGSDEDFRRRFFVPGIQRAGGLSAAMRLVNNLRVDLTDKEAEPSE